MSINKLVSIENPIIDAITDLGLDHDKDYPVFMRWAENAFKKIGSYYQYERKRAVLDITGCAACLPCDAMILERAIMGDFGCDCESLFNECFSSGRIEVDQSNGDLSGFLIVDLAATSQNPQVYGLVKYTIQDNKIIFNNNYDGQKVTIQYVGVKTDCNGLVMISENSVEAITTYIKYMHFTRKKRKSGAELQEMQFWYREWNRCCSDARAEDATLNESDRFAMADMLNNPYAGIGLWKGMRTTLDFTGITAF